MDRLDRCRGVPSQSALYNQHLLNGQRVDFQLSDGQWLIKTNGDVSRDYESRLDLGMTCLESSLNIFDAMHSPAPRVGPTRAVRLGDSLWVITRQTTFNWNKPDAKVRIERCASAGGWYVEYVQLPRMASPQLVAELAGWLQRPIRPARACVFVASPWPSAYTSTGVAVYPMIAGGFEIIFRSKGGSATCRRAWAGNGGSAPSNRSSVGAAGSWIVDGGGKR